MSTPRSAAWPGARMGWDGDKTQSDWPCPVCGADPENRCLRLGTDPVSMLTEGDELWSVHAERGEMPGALDFRGYGTAQRVVDGVTRTIRTRPGRRRGRGAA